MAYQSTGQQVGRYWPHTGMYVPRAGRGQVQPDYYAMQRQVGNQVGVKHYWDHYRHMWRREPGTGSQVGYIILTDKLDNTKVQVAPTSTFYVPTPVTLADALRWKNWDPTRYIVSNSGNRDSAWWPSGAVQWPTGLSLTQPPNGPIVPNVPPAASSQIAAVIGADEGTVTLFDKVDQMFYKVVPIESKPMRYGVVIAGVAALSLGLWYLLKK